jgi:glucokinase-like ROK family protein
MAKRNSVDHTMMRDMNLALILHTLRTDAPLSRAEIAATTGLNKATVSSMIRDLLQNDFVRELENGQAPAEVGRPAIMIEPNPEAGTFIGAEINVDFISIVIANFSVEILSRRFESTSHLHSQEAILQRFLFLLHEAVQQAQGSGRPLFGIGVGVPGLVDVRTGQLIFAPNLNWQDVDLRRLIQERVDVPVYVMNEANQAALGERYFGAGITSSYMLYVSFGIGIGGGIVSTGALVEGATGFAGEVGHMAVEREGLRCNCGSRGCWETVAGSGALLRRVREAVSKGQDTWLVTATSGDLARLEIGLVVEAARRGDSVALDALHETAVWMGIGLANLMNILNPERVVIGGPLSEAQAFVLPVIRETVAERAWDQVSDRAEIVMAAHGRDATVLGGVASVYRGVLNNPRNWLAGSPRSWQPT